MPHIQLQPLGNKLRGSQSWDSPSLREARAHHRAVVLASHGVILPPCVQTEQGSAAAAAGAASSSSTPCNQHSLGRTRLKSRDNFLAWWRVGRRSKSSKVADMPAMGRQSSEWSAGSESHHYSSDEEMQGHRAAPFPHSPSGGDAQLTIDQQLTLRYRGCVASHSSSFRSHSASSTRTADTNFANRNATCTPYTTILNLSASRKPAGSRTVAAIVDCEATAPASAQLAATDPPGGNGGAKAATDEQLSARRSNRRGAPGRGVIPAHAIDPADAIAPAYAIAPSNTAPSSSTTASWANLSPASLGSASSSVPSTYPSILEAAAIKAITAAASAAAAAAAAAHYTSSPQ